MSIHTILSQEIEKLMNKMGTDHRIFMLADGKTRNDLENTIRSFAIRIVEEVGEELVGNDEYYFPDLKGYRETNIKIHSRNELRKEQRTKLHKMKEI